MSGVGIDAASDAVELEDVPRAHPATAVKTTSSEALLTEAMGDPINESEVSGPTS